MAFCSWVHIKSHGKCDDGHGHGHGHDHDHAKEEREMHQMKRQFTTFKQLMNKLVAEEILKKEESEDYDKTKNNIAALVKVI